MSSLLFEPIILESLKVPNRVVVAPMCQYSAVDGTMNDWHIANAGSFARSGPGLIILEATGVVAHGRITHGCSGLYSDGNETALGRVVAFCKSVGHSRVGVQLAHAGRKASTQRPWEGGGALTEGNWQTYAPSAIAFDNGWHTPKALDEADMTRIKKAFVEAAERALRIDMDVIELHAAHGYLLHQFLSPLSNQRADSYGGSISNRMRFPLEIFDAVRAVWPEDRPLLVRVSASDWVEGGWDLEQTAQFAEQLQEHGCSAIHVSSGGNSPFQKIAVGPGYQVGFASFIRQRVSMPVIAVGMITDPFQAETIIRSGQADMVALAREFLRDPHWTWSAAKALRVTTSVPEQYHRAVSFD